VASGLEGLYRARAMQDLPETGLAQDGQLIDRLHERVQKTLQSFREEMLAGFSTLVQEHTRQILEQVARTGTSSPRASREKGPKQPPSPPRLRPSKTMPLGERQRLKKKAQPDNDKPSAVLPQGRPAPAPSDIAKKKLQADIDNTSVVPPAPLPQTVPAPEKTAPNTWAVVPTSVQPAIASPCETSPAHLPVPLDEDSSSGMWELAVTVVKATGLLSMDFMSKSDPYCICQIVGKPDSRFKTPVVKDCHDPVWNFSEVIEEYEEGDELEISLFDKDTFSKDDCLGVARVSRFPFSGKLALFGEGAGQNSYIFIDAEVMKASQSSIRRKINMKHKHVDNHGIDALLSEARTKSLGSAFGVDSSFFTLWRRLQEALKRLSSRRSQKLALLLDSCMFDVARGALMLWDVAVTLWKTEDAITLRPGGRRENAAMVILTYILFFLFLTDFVVRLLAAGRSLHPVWSCFDAFSIFTYLLEIINYGTSMTPKSSVVSWLANLRMFRLWQCVAVIDRVPSEVVLMMRSMTGTLRTTLSCFMTLTAFLLTFGVLFVDGTISYCVDTDTLADASTEELRNAFGTVSSAVLSLFQAISGGDDWKVFYEVLLPLHWFYPVIFLFFMFYSVFAFMNIIIGTMVESILAAARNDRDVMVKSEKASKMEFLHNMTSIYKAVDTDGSGGISLAELQTHMEDADVCAYFAALGVDASQVRNLFLLLDDDQSGIISKDEFLKGVLRLRGEAKSLDIAILAYELELIHDHLDEIEKAARLAGRSYTHVSDTNDEPLLPSTSLPPEQLAQAKKSPVIHVSPGPHCHYDSETSPLARHLAALVHLNSFDNDDDIIV